METIRKSLGILLLIIAVAVQSWAVGYDIDKAGSTVKWNGKKVTGEHYGSVNIRSGQLQVENNLIKSANIKMDMNSIVVEDITNESTNKKLTGHLKSEDFFSVDKHPDANLEIKEVVKKSGNNYTFKGDLTIKNITHPITFDATTNVANGKLSAKGVAEVDRTLYDIKFRSGKFFTNLGDNLIYDTFSLTFDIVANESGKATSDIN